MFRAALFIIAEIWKELKCPSTDKWINKLCYSYNSEYYSVSKKKGNFVACYIINEAGRILC